MTSAPPTMALHIFILLTGLWYGCTDGKMYVVTGAKDTSSNTPGEDTSTTSDTNKTVDTGQGTDTPIDSDSDEELTFQFEAESYDFLDNQGTSRSWYTMTIDNAPVVEPDSDENYSETASGGAYIEALPDEENTPSTAFLEGYRNNPEAGSQVGYYVNLPVAGRYYIWVRSYACFNHDNTIFAGIDGTWRVVQFPSNTGEWVWSSNERDSGGLTYGIPNSVYFDIAQPGQYQVTFCMREDGFNFDKWVITADPNIVL